MAKATTFLFLALLMSAEAGAAFASPDGVWQTISDQDGKPQALIRVETVGGQVRGTIIGGPHGEDQHRTCDRCPGDRRGKPITGLEIMWGLKPEPGNPRKYTGGRILDPSSGNIYGADLTESPDGRTLMVHGYLGLSFLGRTQTWHRAQ